jgi:hypothetical protein
MSSKFEAEIGPRLAHMDLLSRYARAMDTRDWPGMRALFTDDARFGARMIIEGETAHEIELGTPDEAIKFIGGVVSTTAASHYLVSNHLLELDPGGQSATAYCYIRAYHLGRGEKANLWEESIGYFDLKTVLVGDEWKIRWMRENNTITAGTRDVFGAVPEAPAPQG